MNIIKKLFILCIFIVSAMQRCAFRVNEEGMPEQTDREPFIIEGMDECSQYNGQLGCCDSGNNAQQVNSYVQIDGIFGSLGDGCDICAINLKRFWCQYACSPNQSDFVSASKDFTPIPDPRNPDQTIMVQKVNITVEAQTACDLFDSCKRNSFVSSVSAMSTPAGFLTFQGHNAPDDSNQDIYFSFSYHTNDSLFFTDSSEQQSGKRLQRCNYTTNQSTVHGFKFSKNCTCNTCEESCKNDQGFIYTESSILDGFNYILVGSVWSVSIVITVLLTWFRRKRNGQGIKTE